MPCACPCNYRTPHRQCGLTGVPRSAAHRCACSECGHSGCHVRIEWSETYCWVCEGMWHVAEQKAETDADVQRPKKKRAKKMQGNIAAEAVSRRDVVDLTSAKIAKVAAFAPEHLYEPLPSKKTASDK